VFGAQGKNKRRYTHVFDGLGKISRFNFPTSTEGDDSQGSVEFSTKFLRSSWHKKVVQDGEDLPVHVTMGTTEPALDPKQYATLAKNVMFSKFDNANVNVHQVGGLGQGGPWMALTDVRDGHVQFDPDSLATLSRPAESPDSVTLQMGLGLGLELFSNAHPKAVRGSTLNHAVEVKLLPTASNRAHIIRTDPQLRRQIVGSVDTGPGKIPYVHDFSVTDKYAVVVHWPVEIDVQSAFSGQGLLQQMKWREQQPTRIHVFDISDEAMERADGADRPPVASFETTAMFALHNINAFEATAADGSLEIVLDVDAYPDAASLGAENFGFIGNWASAEGRRKMQPLGECYRWRLPMDNSPPASPAAPAKWVQPQKLSAVTAQGRRMKFEVPRINPLVEGRPFRFSYSVVTGAGEGQGELSSWPLMKLDHSQAAQQAPVTALTWAAQGCFPSEPVFVPRSEADPLREQQGEEAGAEDDGYLLSTVFDCSRQESFLLVLDAAHMTELARCYTGMVIPFDIHGEFFRPQSTENKPLSCPSNLTH